MTFYNAPIRGTARNSFPGDQVFIMSSAFVDVSGNLWPAGTEYLGGQAVIDDTLPGSPLTQHVTIAGQQRTFIGKPTK